jgi:hypothetical protein
MSRPIEPHDLDDVFRYHQPTPEQEQAYLEVQAVMQQAAQTLLRHCPASTDRDHAMRQLRDARMWANASIALEGRY